MFLRNIVFTIVFLSGSLFALAQDFNNPFDESLKTGQKLLFFQRYKPENARTGEKIYTVNYTYWKAEKNVNKVIIYNHGLQSHRAWFNLVGEDFVKRGYSLYAFDRIGTADSSIRMASIDDEEVIVGDTPSWKIFLKTLQLMIDMAKAENPGAEIYLWANSYAAKIVTAYLIANGDRDLTGVIFTTPGLYRNKESMPLTFSKVSYLLGGPDKAFPIPMQALDGDNGAHWFTSDPIFAERIKDDELSTRFVTKRFYEETQKMDSYIANNKSKMAKIKIPRFYLLVDCDVMMDNEKVLKFVAENSYKTRVKFYSGGPDHKHFLTFTEDAPFVLDDISAFIDGLDLGFTELIAE